MLRERGGGRRRKYRERGQARAGNIKSVNMGDLSEMFSNVALPYHEICPICPGQLMLNTRRQVYLHLKSTVHQDREKFLGLQDDASSTASSSRMYQ